MISISDQIRNVIYRFANAFDEKDWDSMRSVLADRIECDYSHLRGSKKCLTKSDYVALRKNALGELMTQHLFSNLEIDLVGDVANVCLTAMIFRCSQDGVHFNTHAMYRMGLGMEAGHWTINKIQQKVLWNDGDPSIHTGVIVK